jgi:hypothetical protein
MRVAGGGACNTRSSTTGMGCLQSAGFCRARTRSSAVADAGCRGSWLQRLSVAVCEVCSDACCHAGEVAHRRHPIATPTPDVVLKAAPGDAPRNPDGVSEPRVCRNWRAGATEQTFGFSPAPLRAASSGRIPPTCRQGEVGPDSERVSIVFRSELTNENPPNACDCHRDGVSGTLRRVPPPPIAFCLDSLWVKSQN